MKTIKTKIVFLLTIVIFGFHAQLTNAQQSLKWSLKAGDQFEVTLIQDSNTKTNVDSRQTVMTSNSTIVLDWNVTEVAENGDATIQQSLASIKLSVGDPAVPAQAISYDTNSKEKVSRTSKPLLKQVRPLIGLTFDVVMSPRGEIKEVTLPKATSDVIVTLPETMKLRALFSEKGLQDIFGASAIVLPENDLKAGESWSDESIKITPVGKFNRIRKYAFQGMNTVDGREMAKFSLDATMEKIEGDEPTADSEPMGKLTKFAGSGTLLLDAEAGYFTRSKINNEVQIEKPYREKFITSVVTNEIEMLVRKK